MSGRTVFQQRQRDVWTAATTLNPNATPAELRAMEKAIMPMLSEAWRMGRDGHSLNEPHPAVSTQGAHDA